MSAQVLVRRLESTDNEQYRQVRLHGLLNEPLAFGGCYHDESRWSLADFTARINSPAPSAIFGAFLKNDMVGTVAFTVSPLEKMRHKAILWGMYSLPTVRGLGVGRALLSHLLDYARNQTAIEQVLLAVTKSNLPACRWYDNAGFQLYGIEHRAVKLGDIYDDDELRMLRLDR